MWCDRVGKWDTVVDEGQEFTSSFIIWPVLHAGSARPGPDQITGT